LSWGDLFNLAGTTALRNMDTPIKQFCIGRVDSCDGTDSLGLGPSAEQEKNAPCPVNGKCKTPLGATTVGLIYLNPEGPVDDNGNPQPDPKLTVPDVRDSFERMDQDDRGTVALIGGGHSFGKGHGSCTLGPGKSPKEVYSNPNSNEIPWAGNCGSGKGNDTVTAGFEGPFTTQPLKWDNEFFKLMLDRKWDKKMGQGGHWQWYMTNPTNHAEANLMRLTSDMSLLEDEKYLAIVTEFAHDMNAFNEAFDEAWNKLVTKGGTWSVNRRCDSGVFPEHLLSDRGMLPTDVVV